MLLLEGCFESLRTEFFDKSSPLLLPALFDLLEISSDLSDLLVQLRDLDLPGFELGDSRLNIDPRLELRLCDLGHSRASSLQIALLSLPGQIGGCGADDLFGGVDLINDLLCLRRDQIVAVSEHGVDHIIQSSRTRLEQLFEIVLSSRARDGVDVVGHLIRALVVLRVVLSVLIPEIVLFGELDSPQRLSEGYGGGKVLGGGDEDQEDTG